MALVRQRFPFPNAAVNALSDRRQIENCLHTPALLLWFVLLGFLCRLGSRSAMGPERNTGCLPANLLALSGQAWRLTARRLSAPCTQTVTRFLDFLLPVKLEAVLVSMAYALFRAKHPKRRTRPGHRRGGQRQAADRRELRCQKNGGFGLEHAFRETNKGAANHHLLLQLAHNLWQLLTRGWLRRELKACRKLTDTCLARLLATALRACAPPPDDLPAFQLRFATG